MKILALDGGGVFGFAQAEIMARAECIDKFDCFVGTSIGSAVATGLALGKYDELGGSFFDEWMPRVFDQSILRTMNIFTTKYSDRGLNDALQYVFRGDLFGQAKKPLFVTAVNVSARDLKVFYSGDSRDGNILAWKVVRYATAAETFFKPMDGYADGGVFVNNPVMVAIAAANRVLKVPLEEIEILAIGTGESSGRDGIPRWRLGWGSWLINAMLDGASNSMHNYFAKSLPIKRFQKIEFVRKPCWRMDDTFSMLEAQLKWKHDIEDAVKIVKEF